MPEIPDSNIANNIQDLERLAWTEKLGNCKKPQTLENALKTLYQEIFREACDQEKCFILCLRYLFAIERLCKIGDAKFVKIKYSHEISRVDNKAEELRPILERRYEELAQQKKQKRKALPNKILTKDLELSTTKEEPLFPGEYISTKQLFRAIQNDNNILIVDIRPANEYKESEIQFNKVINIPEDIIHAGLSANVVGKKLNDGTKELWDKRDNFTALVFLDWNSGSDHVMSTKLNYLKASVVEWDCLREYKQPPVILNGGFKEFIDTYPGCVTNVHVNFVRNNEDIDELLELDGITYPESDQNVSTMPLKQFTIEELEESVKIDESSDEEIEEKKDDISSDSISLESTPEEKDTPILPKGGGAALDRPSVELAKDENIDEIKNKIEEQRLQILLEARNMKNKPSNKPVIYTDNKKKFIEEYVGDRLENKPKVVPPMIRRDTKPKRQEFVFGGWCGLVNIKNTCYMNTVLQCLKCVPVVSAFVHSNFEKFITRRPPQIIYEFASVIKKLCEGTESDKKSYRPQSFYDVICRLDPIYKKGKHEDCMEFFLFLFNHLSDDYSYDIKKSTVMIEREKAWYGHLQGRTSLWVDLFYHQFKCTKVCQVCHSKADSYETDNTLMLPVPYRPSLRMVHLKELIAEYLEDNQILDYKCSKCHHMRVVNKKSVVIEPEILVIVLKRYYQDEYGETKKNNTYVDFDLNFRFGNCYYKLCSIAQHNGTMDFGHYYGHGTVNENLWIKFDDERTTRFTGDWDSIKGSACAFFYSKVNMNKSSKL